MPIAKQRRPLLVATCVSAFWGVGGLLSIVPALMSAVIFDLPGAEPSPLRWLLFAAVLSFPACCVAAVVVSLVGGFRARSAELRESGERWPMRLIWIGATLPLLSVAAVAISFLLLEAS